MSKVGVGIVGLSAKRGWASMAHVPALRRVPDFELRGLTGSSLQSAQEAAAKFDVPFFSDDPAALAARPEIDLVVVAVKVTEHRGPVEAALNAHKMVYCEWPLGRNLAEAEAMTTLAGRQGVRAFVGLQARAAPTLRYVRDLIQEGYVGDVLSTSVVASPGPAWNGAVSPAQKYQLDRANGATMLTIPCAHTLDALCWIFGELGSIRATLSVRRPQASITGTSETLPMTAPDVLAVSGLFPSGAVASIHYRTSSPPGTGFRWEINGTRGTLLLTGANGHLQFGMVGIHGATGAEKELTELKLPQQYAAADALQNDQSVALAHAYRHVLSDLRSDSHLATTFADGLVRHRMLEEIERAATA
jgi:predicted dehydrogenase